MRPSESNRGAQTAPHISVVIPTCDRPADLRRCLTHLMHVRYPSWDVLVVDQSTDTHSKNLVASYAKQLRVLMYRHMEGKGLSRSRNIGLHETNGEIVAFLDDDCTVDPDWLDQIAAAFMLHPEAELVYGALRSGVQGATQAYVPTFEIPKEVALKGRGAFFRGPGAGASMYLRRSLIKKVGIYDIHMGTGALFLSSEDWDYHYRTLCSGCAILMTPSIVVWHYGARDYQSGAASRLLRASCYSHGALDMKLLRARKFMATPLIVSRVWHHCRAIQLSNLVMGRRPTGIARILMYVRGLVWSFQLRVDRERCLYLPTESEATSLEGVALASRTVAE
jgi:GT2 family glycosyltransferase